MAGGTVREKGFNTSGAHFVRIDGLHVVFLDGEAFSYFFLTITTVVGDHIEVYVIQHVVLG